MESNFRLIFDFYVRKYQEQFNEWNQIDQKAKISLSIYGVLFAVYFQIGPFTDDVILNNIFNAIMFAWLICLTIGIVFLLMAFKLHKITVLDDLDINSEEKCVQFLMNDNYLNLKDMAKSYRFVISLNEETIEKKKSDLYTGTNLFLPINFGFGILFLFLKRLFMYSSF